MTIKNVNLLYAIISKDSSQCHLSMYVSPLYERPISHFIRSIRNDLETIDLKGRVATPGFHVIIPKTQNQ